MPNGSRVWAGLADWIRHGDLGNSSLTIVLHLTRIDLGARFHQDVPHDEAGLRRCMLLLESVPDLKSIFHRMSEHSAAWAAMADSWEELCALMDAENPDWRNGAGSCPQTFDRISAIRGNSNRASPKTKHRPRGSI